MQNQGNRKKLELEMKTTLTKYFLEISDSCEVSVESFSQKEEDGKFTLGIAVQCIKGGKYYDLQSAVLVSGQSFKLLSQREG